LNCVNDKTGKSAAKVFNALGKVLNNVNEHVGLSPTLDTQSLNVKLNFYFSINL